jgi:hypothetical protein
MFAIIITFEQEDFIAIFTMKTAAYETPVQRGEVENLIQSFSAMDPRTGEVKTPITDSHISKFICSATWLESMQRRVPLHRLLLLFLSSGCLPRPPSLPPAGSLPSGRTFCVRRGPDKCKWGTGSIRWYQRECGGWRGGQGGAPWLRRPARMGGAALCALRMDAAALDLCKPSRSEGAPPERRVRAGPGEG